MRGTSPVSVWYPWQVCSPCCWAADHGLASGGFCDAEILRFWLYQKRLFFNFYFSITGAIHYISFRCTIWWLDTCQKIFVCIWFLYSVSCLRRSHLKFTKKFPLCLFSSPCGFIFTLTSLTSLKFILVWSVRSSFIHGDSCIYFAPSHLKELFYCVTLSVFQVFNKIVCWYYLFFSQKLYLYFFLLFDCTGCTSRTM